MDLVKSMHGKVCEHSDVYFTERYGKQYSARLCNPNPASSASQTANREKFASATKAAAAAIADNEQRATLLKAFNRQKKYRSFYGYVCAKEYEKIN